MVDRPKRVIVKPPRYQTTSSDEAPKRPRIQASRDVQTNDIDEDINDLRAVLHDNMNRDDNDIYNDTSHTHSITHTQYPTPRTYTYIPTRTDSESHTNLTTYTHTSHNTVIDISQAAHTPATYTQTYAHTNPSTHVNIPYIENAQTINNNETHLQDISEPWTARQISSGNKHQLLGRDLNQGSTHGRHVEIQSEIAVDHPHGR